MRPFLNCSLLIYLMCFAALAVNAQTWSPVGTGVTGGPPPSILDLEVYKGELYAGGSFAYAGGVLSVQIARWNDTNWLAAGVGTNYAGNVNTLRRFDTLLYIGGGFTQAGNITANYIATWNGVSWSAVSPGLNNAVWSFGSYNSDLFVGGQFTGSTGNSLAKWAGNSWLYPGILTMSGGFTSVMTMTVYNNELYIGGYFTTAGGISTGLIAKWNGSVWSSVGTGVSGTMNPRVEALEVYNGELYAGGWFNTAGGVPASYIAKWNGSSWTPVGNGMNGIVYALKVFNGELYAGGSFSSAGGNSVANVAKWNGNTWSAAATGQQPNNWVHCFEIYNGALYAAGFFDSAGSTKVNYIAKLTPCTAVPLQPGPIAGSITACSGSAKTYTISPAAGALSYTWTLPAGWTGTSNSNSINVIPSGSSGTISVAAVNSCGASATQSVAVTVFASPAPVIVKTMNTLTTSQSYAAYQWYFNGSPIAGAISQSYATSQPGNYYVIVTDANNCTGQSNPLLITGINDADDINSIQLYPNPNKGVFTIKGEVPLLTGNIQLEIRDISGRLLHKENFTSANGMLNREVNVSGLAPGVYATRLSSDELQHVLLFTKTTE